MSRRFTGPPCARWVIVATFAFVGLASWPGGTVGKVCRQLDGAALIWDFFRQHPKP